VITITQLTNNQNDQFQYKSESDRKIQLTEKYRKTLLKREIRIHGYNYNMIWVLRDLVNHDHKITKQHAILH